MPISVTCPKCSKAYELGEEFAGKKVACGCGETFRVPGAAAVTKPCPSCGAQMPIANVICTECGGNFGAKPGPKPRVRSAAGPSFMESYGKLLVKVVLLAIVAGIGWTAYKALTKKPFGITESTPLGTVEAVREHFTQMGLVQEEEKDVDGIRVIRYRDKTLEEQSRGSLFDTAALAVAPDGTVCGMQSVFETYDGSVPGALYTPLGQFATQVLDSMHEGLKPQFAQSESGGGLLGGSGEVAEQDLGTYRMSWRRSEGFGLISWRNTLTLTLPGKEAVFAQRYE